MGNTAFVEQIAACVRKHAASYGICVYSPIIAQAILESASGTSELAIYANNFFGLKWRENRCPTSNGYYIKEGSEQNPDGSYVSSAMKWFTFPNMEACVQGYFDFINNSRYANLKGVTNPEIYLQNIKSDGYATSIKYVENLLNVIQKYNLTKYDNMEDKKMLRIAIDAGHYINTSGKRCMKKFDPNETREWTLNDRIADKLEKLLRAYNCEVLRIDDTTGLINTSLSNRCKKSNSWNADVYISIHHNGGIKGGSGGGTVVFYYSSKPERKTQAQDLYNSIVAATGLIGNRSSKVVKKNYYVLSHTNAAAFLIENGFMDSATDVPIILSEEHAEKTAQGLLNFIVKEYSLIKKAADLQENATNNNVVYRVQCGAFKNKNNAEALKEQLKAAGYPAIIVST